jgi:hypothetical protein
MKKSSTQFVRKNSERGAAMMIAVIFFILASVLLVLGLTGPSAREYRIAADSISSRQSYFLGESGTEDAYYRIKNGMHIDASETITLGGHSATTTITSLGGGQEELVGEGSVGGNERSSTMIITTGTGVVFNYAVEADDGGVDMQDTSSVTGDIHSDGTIHGEDGITITGDITAGDTSIGTPNTITGDNVSDLIHITGGAHANTINYADATGTLYCTNTTGATSACTSSPDPAYLALPISSSTITDWQTDAASGGTISGSYTVTTTATVGPKKITGDLTIATGASLTVSGVIWVTGNLVVSGTGDIALSSSYGSTSGLIVVDGTITVSSSGTIAGSGNPGSYLMLLSNDNSASAILYGGSGDGILYAPLGTIELTGAASITAALGYSVILSNTASVTYDSALLTQDFQSGTTGSVGILSWKETQ